MMLQAAIKKSAKDGANKKRKKVSILIEEMEKAILANMDHQINFSHGCQKQLTFFVLVGMGICGDQEVWDLHGDDISIRVDKEGKDYVRFQERQSKNNANTLARDNEEQFRSVYHTYKPDFLMTVRQYLRHLPELTEGTKPDLFLGPITNPTGNIWYSRVHKVAKNRTTKWLKSMSTLVGLPGDSFSNRMGRATLITRIAAKGIPNEIGRLISGHHTVSGYQRYDRTQTLRSMEAATLVDSNPMLNYNPTLTEVSRKFV